jgi:serine kinase of HPr protein (carbohydrate metabolism regulator)
MRPAFPTIHACALIVGDAGLLIRGPSRSGKSSLTLALLAAAEAEGRFARLVADDRVGLSVEGGQLFGAPHPLIAGQIEQRGTGILTLPYEDKARLTHVVDLVGGPEGPIRPIGKIRVEEVELDQIEIPASLPKEAAALELLAKI